MGSDPPPNDVRLTSDPLRTVTECGPPVAVPRHFEDAVVTGHAPHAQSRPERPVRRHQIRYEGIRNHLAKRRLLLGRQLLPVSFEARERLERRHYSSAEPSASRWSNMASTDAWLTPRPAAISSSASRSPASHSWVKNQA